MKVKYTKVIILISLLVFIMTPHVTAQENEESSDSALSSAAEYIKNKIDIHGFISQGYLHTNRNNIIPGSENGTYDFNEIGINFASQLTEKLRVGIQFISRDYGVADNNKIKIDWALIDYRFYDWLGLRLGKMKTPLGLFSEIRDIDSLRTSILLPINNLYSEIYREVLGYTVGAGLYGNIFTDNWGTFAYAFQYGDIDFDAQDGGTSQLARTISFGDYRDIESDYLYMGHLEWYTPLEGLRLGISAGQYQYSHTYTLNLWGSFFYGLPVGSTWIMSFDNMRSYVASAEYSIGDFSIFSEIMRLQINFEGTGFSGELLAYNYYAGASYRFCDWFEAGSYYSERINPNDRDGARASRFGGPAYSVETKDFAISTRFDIKEYLIFKCEYHHIDGSADMLSIYNPEGASGSTNMIVFKTTYSF